MPEQDQGDIFGDASCCPCLVSFTNFHLSSHPSSFKNTLSPTQSLCLPLPFYLQHSLSLFVCHEHKPTQLGGKLIDDYLALLRCFADSPFFSIAPLLATTYSFISLTHPPHHLPASPLSTVSTPPAPTLPSVHCHSQVFSLPVLGRGTPGSLPR